MHQQNPVHKPEIVLKTVLFMSFWPNERELNNTLGEEVHQFGPYITDLRGKKIPSMWRRQRWWSVTVLIVRETGDYYGPNKRHGKFSPKIRLCSVLT